MNNLIKLIGRINYRSNKCGCKETTLILSNFCNKNLHNMNYKQLLLLEKLIQEDDLTILGWVMDKENSPPQYNELIEQIKKLSLEVNA